MQPTENRIEDACITNIVLIFLSTSMQTVPINVTLQRKKSMPDFQELPRATEAMSREEVSALGSARREAVRRQIEVNERLRANPLLYLVSPQVKVSAERTASCTRCSVFLLSLNRIGLCAAS